MSPNNSTDTVEHKYALLRQAFPELPIDPSNWGPDGLDLLLDMIQAGPLSKQSAADLIAKNIKMYITKEARGVGGGWHENIFGDRWITLDKDSDRWYRLITLGHEGLHLQQPIRKRCSVEGEYDAWRFGYALSAELASQGAVPPMSEDEYRLVAMPDNPTRQDLKTAQGLMQRIAGPYYLIGKAPLQADDWQTFFLAPILIMVNTFIARGDRI